MLNFAVGPVPSNEAIKAIGAQDTPYFRTPEFSKTMLENEQILCDLANAQKGSRAVFLTASGTGAMEAVVMGILDPEKDKALIVDGGSFGHRFRQMLELHHIPYDAIELEPGSSLTRVDLDAVNGNYTAFLVNLGETSQGVLYDADLIADYCRKNDLFLIVDGISSFLADPFDMSKIGANVLITDAQKALACPPGVAPIVLDPYAVKRVNEIEQQCMYFDLRDLLKNQERGQTPFTPAVTILLQIHEQLKHIAENGGAQTAVDECHRVACDFRARLAAEGLPLEMRLDAPSNAVTYITVDPKLHAEELVSIMKDEYGIWLCPNGGASSDTSFRVGHIGTHPLSDNALLIAALKDVCTRLMDNA